MASTRTEARIVIGLHFGHDYSSVARGDTWDRNKGTSNIQTVVFRQKPRLNCESVAFRSAIAYETDQTTVSAWGNYIRPAHEAGPFYSDLKVKIAEEAVAQASMIETTGKWDKGNLLNDKTLMNISKPERSNSLADRSLLNIRKSTLVDKNLGAQQGLREARHLLKLLNNQPLPLLSDTPTPDLEYMPINFSANKLKAESGFNIVKGKDPCSPSENPAVLATKSTLEVVTDLFRCAQEAIWEECGRIYGADIFTDARKELVISVPVDWVQRVKDSLVKAIGRAFQSGSLSIHVADEEEVAALYVLKYRQENCGLEIRAGDVYTLVDYRDNFSTAVRSYQVSQTSPVLAIEQMAPASVSSRSAATPQEHFLRWLERWIGAERCSKVPEAKLKASSQLLTTFNTCLFHFWGEEEFADEVRLPVEMGIDDDEHLRVEGRMLELSGEQMKQILDPCLDPVLDLIDQQVHLCSIKPKGIMLMGRGIRMVPYLAAKIRGYCAARAIPALDPRFYQQYASVTSCVDYGAVLYGLEAEARGLSKLRLSRANFGFVIPETDGEIEWVVEKGDRLPEELMLRKTTIIKRFIASIDGSDLTMEDQESDIIMVRSDQDKVPKSLTDPSVQTIVKFGMPSFPSERMNPAVDFTSRWINSEGKQVYEVVFQIRAKFDGGTSSFVVLHRGEKIGSLKLEFDGL